MNYQKEFYRSNLPHLQPLGGTFFVTYNLVGCIPKSLALKWEQAYEQKREVLARTSQSFKTELDQLNKIEFAKRDQYLDAQSNEIYFLRNSETAQQVANSLHYWDGQKLELYAYCIMPNHVHTVFRLFNDEETDADVWLQSIMQSIKSYSGKVCNSILGRKGAFWQKESYDRLVRDETELRRILIYILQHPVKAGLCKEARDWEWSYLKEDYNDIW